MRKVLFFDNTQSWLEVGTAVLSEPDTNFTKSILFQKRMFMEKDSILYFLPWIQDALKASNWDKPDLILVPSGPGTFTGLRLTITTARNLVQFWKVSCLSLFSNHFYLQAIRSKVDRDILLALDGKQGKYFFSGWVQGEFLPIQDLSITQIEETSNQYPKADKFYTGKNPFPSPMGAFPLENAYSSFEEIFEPHFWTLPWKVHENFSTIQPEYFRGSYVEKC